MKPNCVEQVFSGTNKIVISGNKKSKYIFNAVSHSLKYSGDLLCDLFFCHILQDTYRVKFGLNSSFNGEVIQINLY